MQVPLHYFLTHVMSWWWVLIFSMSNSCDGRKDSVRICTTAHSKDLHKMNQSQLVQWKNIFHKSNKTAEKLVSHLFTTLSALRLLLFDESHLIYLFRMNGHYVRIFYNITDWKKKRALHFISELKGNRNRNTTNND